MEIRYFGWSGVTIQQADVLVGFDLFGDAVTWEIADDTAATILCLTHGHPEHCGSLRHFLTVPEARPHLATTHLVSSPDVVRHITRGGVLPPDRAHSVSDGESTTIGSVQVMAFTWQHLPLLPPGIGPKIAYAAHLLSHPIELVRIGLGGLGLPMNAPTLGFHITFPDGSTVLNYAEGLHRLTDPHEVESVARTLPAEVLLFAVEPEDVDAIPGWLEILHPSRVYLYEAHRPWRELFRLPYLDLDVYAEELSARFPEMQFSALTRPGQRIAA